MYSSYEAVRDPGAFSEALRTLHGGQEVSGVKVDMAEEGSNLGDGLTSVIKVRGKTML